LPVSSISRVTAIVTPWVVASIVTPWCMDWSDWGNRDSCYRSLGSEGIECSSSGSCSPVNSSVSGCLESLGSGSVVDSALIPIGVNITVASGYVSTMAGFTSALSSSSVVAKVVGSAMLTHGYISSHGNGSQAKSSDYEFHGRN
ncbi:hypothetical protein AWZ03_015348, partial [Drosophila navojoa]